MAKGRHRKGRAKHDSGREAVPAVPEAAAGAPAGGRPPGQRFYDLPYGASAPRLVNPELGLHNLVARVGHNAAYEIDVTLLDAPDHRLIRSGVLLAHRVLEGRGEWFLTAPDWQPLLPKDRIELMGHADLPDELADLIRPLRRRATLGPVAALNCQRREFALRDDAGRTLALLRDDRVTVRRGGLTTARYRELMLTPIGPGLTEDQVAYLDRALVQSGGTHVPRLPRLVTRLGAPATGPTDFPQPAAMDATGSVRRFVSQLVARRLRRIVEADLAVRGGDRSGLTRVLDEAAALRGELAGVSALLDADWVEDLYDELSWILPAGEVDLDRASNQLRSERYLTLLERLVTAVRAPRLAESPSQAAGDALRGLLLTATERLRRSGDALEVEAPAEAWADAAHEVARLEHSAAVIGEVLPDEAAQLADTLAPLRDALGAVQADWAAERAALQAAEQLSPAEAFLAGRDFERVDRAARRRRRDALRVWARARKRLPG